MMMIIIIFDADYYRTNMNLHARVVTFTQDA